MPGTAAADALGGVSGVTGAVGLVRPVADTTSAVVLKKDGATVKIPAQLLQMQRGASSVAGYSLNPATAIPRSAHYSDSIAPDALTADQAAKINWILASVTPAAVPAVSKVPGVSKVAGVPILGLTTPISPAQRAAATQAAIWHYSAGTDLVPGLNASVVEALYKRLTGAANRGLALRNPTLMSAPDADALGNVRGTAGQLVGPFMVSPTVSSVLMKLDGPAGLRLVDEDRVPLNTFRSGRRFFLDVPAGTPPGAAVLTAIGEPKAALGRVVRGVVTGDPGQLLVVADRRALPAEQSSVVRWAAGGLGEGVAVTPTCVAEGIGVELDNTGRQLPLRALVDQRAVTVPAGATKVVPVRVPEGERYDIPVSDGVRKLQLEGVRHCASGMTPVLTAAPDCASGGMGVTIINDAVARDAVFSVNDRVVRVAQQATETVRVPVAEGARYKIQVLGQDGFSRAFSGVRNCAAQSRLDAAKPGEQGAAALPVTGAALGGVVVGGIALLGAGALALFLARRSRRARLPQ
jgi:TQXA domain-containing protein